MCFMIYISLPLPFKMQEQDELDCLLEMSQNCRTELVTRTVAEGELLISVLHFWVYPSSSDDLCIFFHLECVAGRVKIGWGRCKVPAWRGNIQRRHPNFALELEAELGSLLNVLHRRKIWFPQHFDVDPHSEEFFGESHFLYVCK